MSGARLPGWFCIVICLLITLRADGFNVGITYLRDAVAKGAVCLDGSATAYHMAPGFGTGINNWLVHLREEDGATMSQIA
ncbi:hypothetical protein GIB67_004941 [Kingdonia uniflora]|uniref:Pectin acetylesterase n=1 Tax=Kingdonia uniflora TaxID=39325 RepID=A0A7J7PAT1_9MAGN|nr:hypothetical protein GIB67_004941 [Kingdonia uniflora]